MPTHDGEPKNSEREDALHVVHELLKDFGVKANEPQDQAKLAHRLVNEGFTEGDAAILEDYLAETEKDECVRSIAGIAWKILKTKASWSSFMVSARRAYDRRRKQAEPKETHQYNEMRETCDAPNPEWAAQELRRRAWCSLIYDRRPVPDVAAICDVDESEVVQIAREGGLLGGHSEEQVEHDVKLRTDEKYREQHMKKVSRSLSGKKPTTNPNTDE